MRQHVSFLLYAPGRLAVTYLECDRQAVWVLDFENLGNFRVERAFVYVSTVLFSLNLLYGTYAEKLVLGDRFRQTCWQLWWSTEDAVW